MDVVSVGSCLVAGLLYYGTLDAGFVYDDSRAILSNQDVLPSTPVSRLLTDDFWGTPLSHGGSHGSYRPLCVLSFRLNYLAGGFRAWGYHLVNVLLHCLATGLVVRLARVLFPPATTLPAAVTGLLFAAHPIHSEAVAGIVGRADLVACILYLLSFLCYVSHVKYRDKTPRPKTSTRRDCPQYSTETSYPCTSQCHRHHNHHTHNNLDNNFHSKPNTHFCVCVNVHQKRLASQREVISKCDHQRAQESTVILSGFWKYLSVLKNCVGILCDYLEGRKMVNDTSGGCSGINKCLSTLRGSVNVVCDSIGKSGVPVDKLKSSRVNKCLGNCTDVLCEPLKESLGNCATARKSTILRNCLSCLKIAMCEHSDRNCSECQCLPLKGCEAIHGGRVGSVCALCANLGKNKENSRSGNRCIPLKNGSSTVRRCMETSNGFCDPQTGTRDKDDVVKQSGKYAPSMKDCRACLCNFKDSGRSPKRKCCMSGFCNNSEQCKEKRQSVVKLGSGNKGSGEFIPKDINSTCTHNKLPTVDSDKKGEYTDGHKITPDQGRPLKKGSSGDKTGNRREVRREKEVSSTRLKKCAETSRRAKCLRVPKCQCEGDVDRCPRLKQWLYMGGCLLLAAGAILSKETGVTVLLVCGAYDLLVHLHHWKGGGFRDLLAKKPPRGLAASLACLLLALCTLLLLRLRVMGTHTPVFATADNPTARSPSPITRCLTFAFLPVFNFALLLFPQWLSFDWSMDAIPRVNSLLDPRVFLSGIFYYALYRAASTATRMQLSPPSTATMTDSQHRLRSHKHRRHLVYRRLYQPPHQDFQKSYNQSSKQKSTCPVCRHSLLDHHSALCRTSNNNNTISPPGVTGSKCSCSPKRPPTRLSSWSRNLNNGEILLVCLAFMVIPFLPATNLFFYVGFVVAERVLYTPSVGYCLLVGLGCQVLYARTSRKMVLVACVVLVLTVLGARTVRRNGDWMDEERLYRSGIPVNPPKAYGNLGSVFSSQGRTVEAEWAYRKALHYRGNMADVHYNLGILLQGSERYDEAIQSLQLAIQYRPTLALAHLNLGQLYERVGRCHEAERVYRRCAQLDGSSLKDPRTHEAARVSALLHLGRLCADQGRLHEAVASYQEAVLTMPEYYPPQALYNLLGEAHLRLRHYDQAERWFQAALRAEPGHVPAHLTYGSMLARNKSRVLEAERWFQRALELAPQDPTVHHHFGQFLSSQQRHHEAALFHERAAELAPTQPELAVSAATALRQAGLTERAELFYRRAVELSPQSARSHLNMGAILHLNGKYEEAASRYKEALRLQPGDVTALTNLHKLHSLMSRRGTT